MATFDEQRLSFGEIAAHYDTVRPRYPREAIDWALDGTRKIVVDLGAGTGILTRALIEAGHSVVPVEPDGGMRERLAAATPGVEALAGSAEAIPLPDASVDGVVAGQAYHWFDPVRAPVEIARVLRPGGIFAAIWNIRDESVDWVAELGAIASLADGSGRARTRVADLGPGFGPVLRTEFRHATRHTPETLVALLASRSYYLTAPPARQRSISEGILRLATSHPELAGRDSFDLPYLTEVYRATRP